uniref:Glutamate receptor 1 n=3 Tax=Lygus hesperus TaxID=30085 RepID=A0A0A9XVL7_LYGHE
MRLLIRSALWVLCFVSTVSRGQHYEELVGEEEAEEETPIVKLPIVGYFHQEKSEEEMAFKFAVARINKDKQILPNVDLIETIVNVPTFDSFNTSKSVCNLTSWDQGIGGIVGPPSAETASVVQSICNILEIPHIKIHTDTSVQPSNFSVNLYPPADVLARALKEVVQDMDWMSYVIVYEEDEALVRLADLLKVPRGVTIEGRTPFTVWQLPKPEVEGQTPDYRPLFKEISGTTETHIILDCKTENTVTILEQAKEVNMMGDYHTYFLTSLDSHTVEFGDFKFGPTNITMLRLMDPTRHMLQAIVQDWIYLEWQNGRKLRITPETVMTSSALMYDSVMLFANALHKLNQDVSPTRLTCHGEPLPEPPETGEGEEPGDGGPQEQRLGNGEETNPEIPQEGEGEGEETAEEKPIPTWPVGLPLIEIIKKMNMEGMTGRMSFDEAGNRVSFSLDINELTKSGLKKIGTWDTDVGLTYSRTKEEMDQTFYQSISNKTFIVVSRIGEPYLRIRDENAEGNDRYEGYSMELIDEIAKDLNFKYKFYLAPDGAYGSYNKKTKQWNGLIRELRERRADLAICDLTITYDRRSAVDFTMPFMTLGISILYSKPMKQPANLFSFLLPLSPDVWIYMATAYLGVSLLLYFLSRCSPNEWENPHPCNPDPSELECTFSLHNCLWFSIGSLMAQGCDLLPKAMSTRVVAGMWWFFVLIMISSYTANLAAFLTMERMEATITNVEALAMQNKIKYGGLAGGSTLNFFKDSNNSLYQKMWSVMESARPSVFTKSNDEGVERVLKGNRQYAFFMESTSIEYQMAKHCELMQVGGTLDSKGYGIAMPFNSPYRIAISGAVLKMQESGKLTEIKTKWWKEMNSDDCDAGGSAEGGDSAELGIDNVGGVFLVLIAGCGVAFFVSILEFLWNVRKVAVTEEISPKEAMMLELRFALSTDDTKPVRHTAEVGSTEEEDEGEDEEEADEKKSASFIQEDSYLGVRMFDESEDYSR